MVTGQRGGEGGRDTSGIFVHFAKNSETSKTKILRKLRISAFIPSRIVQKVDKRKAWILALREQLEVQFRGWGWFV